MVKVITTERKSAVLTPSSLACLSRIPTVNLTMGCAHGCLYCYARGYRVYPGEGTVKVYSNSLELLRAELQRRKHKPATIYFSTASDLFQPVPEALDLAYGILQEVFMHGVGVSFLTKGVIPERHMALLQENATLVRAQIGLITLDKALLQIFEPYAATPQVRVAQLKQLTDGGVKTQLRIDPILPALTDDDQTFRELCGTAADAGITAAAASILFHRPAVVNRLRHASKARSTVGKCLSQFRNHQKITIHARQSSVTALPVQHRERIFQRLENIASCYRMTVKRCACKNPDIAGGTCSIAGELRRRHAGTQTTLFD